MSKSTLFCERYGRMLFNSTEFLIFFPIVTIIYFIIPKKVRYIWLLISSYYFYMGWNPKYVVLLLFSTVITYTSGILLGKAPQRIKAVNRGEQIYKKVIVGLSFASNLGVLCYFKYTDFLMMYIEKIMNRLHITMSIPNFDILLPVGISFFTFQALSYTVDVYRGEIYAEKNFLRYALYVSFFPQLVAGPIERSKNLLRQLAIPSKFNFEKARDGFLLMLWGYFLKIVLADRIAIFVDTVYGDIDNYPGWYLIVATILFAIQIYCDFAGYSTIAIGAAEIYGIDLMENFDAPYLSCSVANFWRKWHISLTSWFRDYLYIPLGGNRKGRLRKYFNLMTVFLTSGLWHGASLHYIVWGGINGLYQIIGELLEPLKRKLTRILRLNEDSIGFKIYKMIVTFVLVDFSWIYFRAYRVKAGNKVVLSILNADNPWILFDGSLYKLGLDEKNFRLMLLCIIVLLLVDFVKSKKIAIRQIIAQQDYICRWIIVAFSIFFILTYGIWGPGYDASNFIYFQF